MLGAAGEQLAVYNGVQVKFKEQVETYIEDERFVYMYLHSFISAGGQLVTLADGTKQFNIVDNLGSVRCIVSWDGTAVSTQAFDYKPFGDLQSAGEENRIGYFGEQRDKESDYFAMGFRLYDPEIGRFLAIDPLLDVQPSQTPYHYCFNNPTSFTDPTGLYPEKEKDRVQFWTSDIIDDGVWTFISYSSDYHNFYMFESDVAFGVYSYFGFGKGSDGGTVAGYYMSEVRTGISNFSETGINGIVTITDEYKKQVESNVNLNIGSNVENPEQVAKNFWAAFWEGQGTFTTVENQKFLTTANLTVNIMQRDDYFFFSLKCAYDGDYGTQNIEGFLGWTSYNDINLSSTMTFSEIIFGNNFKNFGQYKFAYIGIGSSIMTGYNLSMILMHEFGHSYAYFTNGESYPCFYFMWSENWAIWYMNTHYCEPNNIPTETYYWSPKKWFKYGKPTP